MPPARSSGARQRARVLLLSAWACEREALEGFAAGADGFALKTESAEALLAAIRAVGRGGKYTSPELHGVTAESVREARPAEAPDGNLRVLDVLSPREREVLDLLLKGWRNRAIGRELCISVKTVDTHRTRINRKLGCTGSPDLIRFAANNGLLHRSAPPPDDDEDARKVVPEVAHEVGHEVAHEVARETHAVTLLALSPALAALENRSARRVGPVPAPRLVPVPVAVAVGVAPRSANGRTPPPF